MARLILERLDPDTNCVDRDWRLDLNDLRFLNNMLSIDEHAWRGSVAFDLSPEQFAGIAGHYRVGTEIGEAPGRIRTRSKVDDLPYKVHTGRELKLMLAGEKPMSVFGRRYPSPMEEPNADRQPFAKWVECGRLRRYEGIVFDGDALDTGIAYTIYTLPKEFWRAEAYLLLKKNGARSGWSAGMERAEGMLLGYSNEQIDIYLATTFGKSSANSKVGTRHRVDGRAAI
jgi:hypothetical protein